MTLGATKTVDGIDSASADIVLLQAYDVLRSSSAPHHCAPRIQDISEVIPLPEQNRTDFRRHSRRTASHSQPAEQLWLG